MSGSNPSLDELRRELDLIDEQIVDLLVGRADVVRLVGEVKGLRGSGRPALRSAREAAIIRRLVARCDNRFANVALVRMWRELFAATTGMQQPLSVAVNVPCDNPGCWDVARDHFGTSTTLIRVESSGQALRAVRDGSAGVAALPLPSDEDPWWLGLLPETDDRLRVIGRLPFAGLSRESGDDTALFVVAGLDFEDSGDDVTLLALEAEAGASRARLRDILSGIGHEPRWIAVSRDASLSLTQHLVEVDGHVAEGTVRPGRDEILRLVHLGGYPRPLSSEDLT
jgi:chorismate mutase